MARTGIVAKIGPKPKIPHLPVLSSNDASTSSIGGSDSDSDTDGPATMANGSGLVTTNSSSRVHDGNGAGKRARRQPVVALRADLDALPIMELTGAPYASQNPGCMVGMAHKIGALGGPML